MCFNSKIQKLKKLSFFDKAIVIYLFFLFIFLFYTSYLNSLTTDEGTHLLLSVFYRDLILHLVNTRDFSFENAYQYGINYLVHYPKLQIAYPPLYHFTTSLFFSIFGLSEFIGKFINITYAILTFLFFYLIIKKFFDSKTAFISTFLFSFSSFSLYYSNRAMADFTVFFWLILSIYIFISGLVKKQTKLFALTGFTSFLATMGKQMGAFIILFFLIILLNKTLKEGNKKRNLKNIFIMLLCFSLPLIPYLLILDKVGGFKINEMVAIGYATSTGNPTSVSDPSFWLYFFIKPIENLQSNEFFPFLPIFLLAFLFYLYKKHPYWKELLLFFLIFYFLLTIIPNKMPRFFQFFFLPCYLSSGFLIGKIKSKSLPLIFLIIYMSISLYIFLPTVKYLPSKDVSDFVFNNKIEGGNVAFISGDVPSVFMWHLLTLDKNRAIRVYSGCMFDNKNSEEIMKLLKDNNIYFVINSVWFNGSQIEKVKDNLTLVNTIGKNDFITEIYTFNNFRYNPNKKICNYICLTKQKICI